MRKAVYRAEKEDGSDGEVLGGGDVIPIAERGGGGGGHAGQLLGRNWNRRLAEQSETRDWQRRRWRILGEGKVLTDQQTSTTPATVTSAGPTGPPSTLSSMSLSSLLSLDTSL